MARSKLSFDEEPEQKTGSQWKKDPMLISSGSTVLNMALSENPFGAYRKGKMVNIVGDSHAGKTFLWWEMVVSMLWDNAFNLYKIYYNNAEHGSGMDLGNIFGSKTAQKVKKRVDLDKYTTINLEKTLVSIKKLFKTNKPFVFGIDSLDALKSIEEMEKTESEIGKRDYPDVPRILSAQLGIIDEMIEDTNSLIFIISQTRKNIGVKFGDSQRRSGGDALRFHCWQEFWLARKRWLYKKGKQKGVLIRVKIKKNRETGKQREAEIAIYDDYGVDDVGSIIEWMVSEGFWDAKRDSKGIIKSTIDTGDDLGLGDYTKEKIIKIVEDKNLEDPLRCLFADYWMEIEDSIATKRKPRYE